MVASLMFENIVPVNNSFKFAGEVVNLFYFVAILLLKNAAPVNNCVEFTGKPIQLLPTLYLTKVVSNMKIKANFILHEGAIRWQTRLNHNVQKIKHGYKNSRRIFTINY